MYAIYKAKYLFLVLLGLSGGDKSCVLFIEQKTYFKSCYDSQWGENSFVLFIEHRVYLQSCLRRKVVCAIHRLDQSWLILLLWHLGVVEVNNLYLLYMKRLKAQLPPNSID